MLINLKNRKMKYLYLVLLIFTGTFVSCIEADSTGDVSFITNYPVITLNGPSTIYLEQGEPYVELGAISTEGDNEIETTISYGSGAYLGSAGVDSDTPDNYVVTYSAVNQDGFSGSNLRNVWVVPPTGDLVTSIEGFYTSSVQRGPTFTPSAQYTDLEYVFIWKISDNVYGLSHGIGGYYDLGRAYGPAYAAAQGTITVNDLASGAITYSGSPIPGFGINITSISDFKVMPGDKMITFTGNGDFANGNFKVQLTQVQF
jgi:hypothetical protein